MVGAPENLLKTGKDIVTNLPELAKNVVQKPEVYNEIFSAFDDGYQFGDLVKTYGKGVLANTMVAGGTTADVGMGFAKGIANVGENLGLDMMQIESNIWDLKGDYEQAEAVRQKMANAENIFSGNISKAQENMNKYSASGSTLDKTMETAGYMVSLWASNTVGGGIGQSAMTIGNTAGQTFAETYREQGTDIPQWAVLLKGIGSGVIEDRVERLGGFFGSTGATDKITSQLMSKTKSGIAKALISLGMDANDEGLEEVAGYTLNSLLDNIIDYSSKLTGDNLKLAKEWDWNELAKDYGFAFISTLISGGARNMSQISALGMSNDMSFSEAVDTFGKMQEQGLNNNIEVSDLKKELKKTQDPSERAWIQNQITELTGEEPKSENGFKNFFNKLKQGFSTEEAIQNNLSEPSQMIPVAENTEMIYNSTEGEIENEFRRIQEEGSRLSNEERRVLYGTDRTRINEIRQNIESLLQTKLENYWSSNNDSKRTITNKQTGETTSFVQVSPQDFYDAFATNRAYMKNPDSVDIHSVEDYKNGKAYLTNNGMSGLFITNDGDVQSVFNNSGKPGFLESISEIVKSEGKTLDCFQNKQQALADLYESAFGYKVASIMDFSREVMEEEHGKEYTDAFVEKYGEAPVYFMVNTDQDIETKHFNKDQYGDAENYRNSFLKNAQDEGSFNLPENQPQQEPGYMDSLTQEVDKQTAPVPLESRKKAFDKSKKKLAELNKKQARLENEIQDTRQFDVADRTRFLDTDDGQNQMKEKYPNWDTMTNAQQNNAVEKELSLLNYNKSLEQMEKELKDVEKQIKKETAFQNKVFPENLDEQNMDNLLQEVDKEVDKQELPIQQKQELPKKKKGKYQSVIESSTNTRIVDKRNKVPLKKTLENVKKLGEDFYQATVNQRYFTDKLAKKVGNDKLIYKGDKALSSGATANFVIDRKQTNYNNTKVVGDSVNGIIERAKKDKVYEPLNDYLYLMNHADRKAQGKGFLGLSRVEALQKANDLVKRYPKIKEYSKEIHDFCHNELQVLVDSGVISEKWATAWEKTYPNYVPVFSQLSGKIEDNIESDTVTGGRGVKKAKGGTYDIAPIDIALANYTTKIRRAVATNNFIKELATSIKMEENGTNENLENYEIIEPESLFEETNAPVQEVDGKYQGIYFENGVAHPFELTKDLYKSAKEISTDTIMDRIGKTIGLQKFTELQRNLQTTYNLPFGAVNYIKDAQAGIYNSKHPFNYEKNVPLAWKELVTNNNKTKNYKAGDTLSTLDTFLANGGLMASYFNSEEGTISNSKGIRGKLANANASIEMSHRVAEYMSTMELREKSLRKQLEAKGLSKKEIDSIIEEQRADIIDEAVYNASEITTNFKRGGAFVKMLNRNGFNYLNASVQGFDRFVRTATRNRTVGEWAGFISKVAVFGVAPVLVNNFFLGDDDDYKKLRDNDKDLYYLIKIGDGKFIRIPKGRELSTFGAWTRRTGEAVGGKGLEAYKGLGETISNQVAPNNPLTDNVFAPLIQAKNNKTWWGGEIVKGQMKNKPAGEQYDEYTDDFSKFLGSKLNISPKKINYALNQYSGGIGDIILPSITTATKGANPVKNVFKDKFTVDSVLKNKLSTDFYDLASKQEALARMTNASDEDKLKSKYLNTMQKELYQFYDEKDKVLNDESLSYEEKQTKVREIQKELNGRMEDIMANYDKIEKVDDDISKIKDEYYIKNKGGKYAGEWRDLYDNEIEEMNRLKKSGISEKDYLRYKQDNTYYDDEGKAHQKKTIEKIDYMVNNMNLDEKQLDSMYKETVGSEDKAYSKYYGSAKTYLRFKLDSDKQKKARTDDSNASVSQADKMNALIDGKYTNKERQELYDTFASEDDYVYKTLKKTNIDVREYLKYKQADLKADRQDNGTLKGKTINGTAKAKVIAYINSMDITYDQKLILMGSRYKMSNAERERVAHYINSLGLSQKDKLEMYNKMKGFTAYKDGRVTW